MYQALYRKWRPKVFSDVIGQSHITQTLQKQVADGKTSHAYLFTGTRGTGKTTCAKILAKAVNCEHPVNGNPCCQCPACLGIENGSFLDVLELDAASNNGVDQVRALRDEAIYSPANVSKRVYIIDEVHMLSTAAFNALLKILEEPPEHLMFILATTELHKVLPTILSRCQRFSFRRIQPRDIAVRLSYVAQQEKIDLQPDGAELLSRLADGALRDGLSLLDQCASVDGRIDSTAVLHMLGLSGNLQTAQLMECILRRDAKAALLLLSQLYSDGKEVSSVLSELSTLTRDLLLRRIAPEGGAALLSGGFDTAMLERLGQDVPVNRFLYLTSTLQTAAADLYKSANRRTDAELCLLRLCDESLSGDLTALDARILRLEERLEQGTAAALPASAAKRPLQRKTAPKPVRTTAREAPYGEDDVPWEEPPVDRDDPASDAVPWEEPPPTEALPVQEAPPTEVPAAPEEMPEPQEERAESSVPAVPAPPPAASAPIATDGNWWRLLAERCKGQLSPMYRAFLDLCTGVLQNGCITVYAPDDITLNRLNNDRVRGILAEEAQTEAGGAVRVVMQVGQAPRSSPQENLDKLVQFGSQFDAVEIK